MAPLLDQSLAMLREGYAFLPDRRRRAGADVVELRLLGRRAVAGCGVAFAEEFYTERFQRHGVLPEPVRSSLFGTGGVHMLDDAAHRQRKHMFIAALTSESVQELVDRACEEWDQAVAHWARAGRVVLRDALPEILLRAAWSWAGIPAQRLQDSGPAAADMMAMVDGFATAGPRHWRARAARSRQEQRLGALVLEARRGDLLVRPNSPLARVAEHRDLDGTLLTARTAAVELLNLLRPTVAVTIFLTFAAHALHRWPDQRERVGSGDPAAVQSFVHELRRFYPFAPLVGALSRSDGTIGGHRVPHGTLVLLDIHGHHRHRDLWERPYEFEPERFDDRDIGPFDLLAQGGGDTATGHRCPGEGLTVVLLAALCKRLERLDASLPPQDLEIPLSRVPTHPRSGVLLTQIVAPGAG